MLLQIHDELIFEVPARSNTTFPVLFAITWNERWRSPCRLKLPSKQDEIGMTSRRCFNPRRRPMANAFVLAVAVALAPAVAASAPPGLPVVVVRAPNADLRLEVARTHRRSGARVDGPSGDRAALGHALRVCARRRGEFWMKNTLVPLDMIFIGADGAVRKSTRTSLPPRHRCPTNESRASPASPSS